MDEVPYGSAKTDRLSSRLPAELLLLIFELASDPDHLLFEPLSKLHLPYFRRNLYRQIRLSSRSSWYKLRKTVKDSPGFGELVHVLDTSGVYVFSKGGQFKDIVKPFPCLNSLKTGYIQPIEHTSTDLALPPLEHLSYEINTLNIGAITYLANLNLSSLEIRFRHIEVVPRSFIAPRLESIRRLSLEMKVDEDDGDDFENHMWWSTPVNIDNCCPNITSLRLFDSTFPDYSMFLVSIAHISPRITSLELDSPGLSNNWHIDCNNLLPLFSNLTHLSLGDGTISEHLPFYIRQIPLLNSLRLGPEAHWNLVASDFFTLLQGPTRQPSLRQLAFNCFGGHIGRRISVNELLDDSVEAGMSKDGWQRPSFRNAFTEEDGLALQSICEENQIVLSGNVTSVSEIQEEYTLEEANRSVLRCLQLKSLDDITSPNGSAYFDQVPIDNLDPENLKLVKTEIPEKNWFRLSLD